MHELSIAEAVVRQTERRLREAGVRPESARTIRVLVGDLSGADVEALEEAFRALLPTTALAGARADVRRDPARVICPRCGVVDAGEPFRLACPKCGGEPERIEGGEDVTVETVEVEDQAEDGKADKKVEEGHHGE